MQIKDVLYKTPEMTEEKLLKIMEDYTKFLRKDSSNRLIELYNKRHNFELPIYLPQVILDEWDIIQQKKSYLTKSQRDEICELVSFCLIQMVRNTTKKEENDGTGE